MLLTWAVLFALNNPVTATQGLRDGVTVWLHSWDVYNHRIGLTNSEPKAAAILPTGDKFIIHVPGLTDQADTISFEALSMPGYFLRALNGQIDLQHRQNVDNPLTFSEACTFLSHADPLFPGSHAFEQLQVSKSFLCHDADNRVKTSQSSSALTTQAEAFVQTARWRLMEVVPTTSLPCTMTALTLYTTRLGANDASAVCVANGARLVLVDSSTNLELIYRVTADMYTWPHVQALSLSNYDVWVGMYTVLIAAPDNFVLNGLNGDPLQPNSDDWYPGEPDKLETQECIRLATYGSIRGLRTKDCNPAYMFMCQNTGSDCIFDVHESYMLPLADPISAIAEIATDINSCRLHCLSKLKDGRECWAVTYAPNIQLCLRYFTTDRSVLLDTSTWIQISGSTLYIKNCLQYQVNTDTVVASAPNGEPTMRLQWPPIMEESIPHTVAISTSAANEITDQPVESTTMNMISTMTLPMTCPDPIACNDSSDINSTCIHEDDPSTREQRDKDTEVMINNLAINKSSISATRRKYISVYDSRPSVVGMGGLGIAMIIFTVGGIILLDLGTLSRDIERIKQNFRSSK